MRHNGQNNPATPPNGLPKLQPKNDWFRLVIIINSQISDHPFCPGRTTTTGVQKYFPYGTLDKPGKQCFYMQKQPPKTHS